MSKNFKIATCILFLVLIASCSLVSATVVIPQNFYLDYGNGTKVLLPAGTYDSVYSQRVDGNIVWFMNYHVFPPSPTPTPTPTPTSTPTPAPTPTPTPTRMPDGGSDPFSGNNPDSGFPEFDLAIAPLNLGVVAPNSSQTIPVPFTYSGNKYAVTALDSSVSLRGFFSCSSLPLYFSDGSGYMNLTFHVASNVAERDYNGSLVFIGLDSFNQVVSSSVPVTFTVSTATPKVASSSSLLYLTVIGAVAFVVLSVVALRERRR